MKVIGQPKINHYEGRFKGAGGVNLYCQCWHPEGQTRAILIVVHGMGGHSDLFGNVVQQLVPEGYAMYAFDLRGNGRSPGQRGYINSWDEFRGDLDAFLTWVLDREPDQPIFLFGHSVGAVIVLDYALRSSRAASKVRGVVVVSPIIGGIGVPPIRVMLGRMLSRVLPRFSLTTGIETKAGSRDPKIVDDFIHDPLRHRYVTARFGTEFFATVDWIHAHAQDWHLPLLILHGDADRVALPEGGQRFFEHVTFSDKERKEYPGGYHEPFNDFNCQEFLTDLERWLENHLRSNEVNRVMSRR